MSFNISFTAPDREAAKDELCRRNTESGSHMPEPMKQAAQALIDAMPDAPEGQIINVATHGHAATEDNPGSSNITLSIMHVLG